MNCLTLGRKIQLPLICFLTASSLFLISCNKDVYVDPPAPGPVEGWKLSSVSVPVALNSIFCTDSLETVAVGDSGIMLRTTDGGINWNIQYLFPGRQINKIKYTSSGQAWICGSNGLLQSSVDGGLTWNQADIGTLATLKDFFFHGLYGWAAGSIDSDTTAAIWHTADGGEHWVRQASHVNEILQGIFFIDSLGWAVGHKGTILRTLDRGDHWEKVLPVTTKNLKQVHFFNPVKGIIVGESGLLLTTIDGGASWTVIQASTFSDLYGIFFLDETTGWISGSNGKIMRTPDAGTTWTVENSNTQGTIMQIDFPDLLHGYACGTGTDSKGFILTYR